MVIVDLRKIAIAQTIRKKLRSPNEYGRNQYGMYKYGEGIIPMGVYQMRRRPYIGKNNKGVKGTMDVCVCSKFYQPSSQIQPNKVITQGIFRDAVHAWQALTTEEKKVYNKESSGEQMSGYNLFLHKYLISH